MVRNGREEALAAWLDEAEGSMIASFARGLRSDQKAVAAALREPWSNGQTEAQINRPKAIKRQMSTSINPLRRAGLMRLEQLEGCPT